MTPRVLCWTAGYWKSPEHAQRFEGTWQGYRAWYDRVQRCFKPIGCFIASGSWSPPELSPVPEAVTVNAGAQWDKPFIFNRTNYSAMAMSAAMAYALNRVRDWDYLVLLETDALLGVLNLPRLFEDFAQRPQTILSPSWCGSIGGPLIVWKPEGAIRMAHHRPYVSFVDDDEPSIPDLPEHQWFDVYRGYTHWWNPFPEHITVRQEYSEEHGRNLDAINWPVIARPHPDLVEPYSKNHREHCVML